MSELQIEYDKLLLDYEILENEHKKLQNEYSENTIIQSMNDMKDVYNSQKKKIEKLNSIIDNILDTNKSIKLMLSSILYKNINNIENSQSKHVLKYRIEFIQEILEDSLRLKNTIYYH